MVNKNLVIFMPSIEGGGVEKNLFIISNYLSKNVKKLSIITVSKKYKKKFNKKISFIAPKFNFWDKFGRKKKYFICLILLLIEFIKNKDILVFCFQANIYCTVLCKILGLKIIVRSNSSPSGWSKNYFKNLIFKKVLNLANCIIVNSFEFRNELKNRFGVKSKCIYNPLNTKQILNLSKKKINNSFFTKDFLNILNIGRLVDQKDQLTLIKAAKILKDRKIKFRLIIIGSGILKLDLNNFIKVNKLKKNIKIINFIDNPYPYFIGSDLFVLSSIYEGLPNVLLESLVLKKYVISANCPTGPKEILDNGKGGTLFKVGDHKNLAEKIYQFHKNKNEIKKKLLFARKRLYRFDYNKNLNKYLEIIRSI